MGSKVTPSALSHKDIYIKDCQPHPHFTRTLVSYNAVLLHLFS